MGYTIDPKSVIPATEFKPERDPETRLPKIDPDTEQYVGGTFKIELLDSKKGHIVAQVSKEITFNRYKDLRKELDQQTISQIIDEYFPELVEEDEVEPEDIPEAPKAPKPKKAAKKK